MQELNWIYLLYLITGLPSLLIFARIAVKVNSLSAALFTSAIFSLVFTVTLSMFWPVSEVIAREWGNLIGITLTLCGILSEIRNSKPVFVRFPTYLTALPLIGILFYPLIIDVEAVQELLLMTYQTGAVIVSVLIVSINHYLYRGRVLLLAGVSTFLIAYILFWFLGDNEQLILAAKILFASGMFISAIGFHKIEEANKTKLRESL